MNRRVFFSGNGSYEVEISHIDLNRETPALVLDVFVFRIVTSTNEEHPVGSERAFVIRKRRMIVGNLERAIVHSEHLSAQATLFDAKIGDRFHLVTTEHITKTSKVFTKHEWHRMQYHSRHSRPVAAVSVATRTENAPSGATCKRCNEHNPYAEPSTSFVCFGCR